MEPMGCGGKKILIVDDNDDVRFVIRMILYDEGYAVVSSAEGTTL